MAAVDMSGYASAGAAAGAGAGGAASAEVGEEDDAALLASVCAPVSGNELCPVESGIRHRLDLIIASSLAQAVAMMMHNFIGHFWAACDGSLPWG